MAREAAKVPSEKPPIERKANVSLKEAELQMLQSLLKDHPEWRGRNGNCTQCVLEEYQMAEPNYCPDTGER